MKVDKNTRGFIPDLSNDDYHADRNFVSSSVIKTAMKDPKEYHRIYIEGGTPKPMNKTALLIGSYIHCALLEKHLLHTDFTVWDGDRRGNAFKAFEATAVANGMEVLNKKEYDMCQEMLSNFNTTKIYTSQTKYIMADTLFQDGYAEESLFTNLEGVDVKVRFDYRLDKDGKHIIRDVKTSREVCNTAKKTKEVVLGLEYDLSAALYIDALAKELKISPDEIEFEWVFVSKSDFKTNMYYATKETIENGRQKYKKGLALIKKFRKEGFDSLFTIEGI
jgi:hypothetical protein